MGKVIVIPSLAPLHSPFGASGAHRWTVCPGSIRLQREWAEKHGPPEETPWAKEGTEAHELAAQCLRNGHDAAEFAQIVNLDDSAIEGVQLYLDTIRHDLKQFGGELEIEKKFGLTDFHAMFWGTADAVLITKTRDMLVYDLKMGRGHIVEIQSHNGGPNVQLGFYALGALHNAGQHINHIQIVLVQPRAWHRDGPVRRAYVDKSSLNTLRDKLIEAAAEAEKPDAKLVPGDHCRFCSAMAGCPAIAQFAYQEAQKNICADPANYGNEDLSQVLEHIDIIEQWIAAVRAHAHVVAAGPKGIPGWKLVDKQGRRRWIDEKQVVRKLCLLWGLDEKDVYKRSLKSPAQVEELLLPDQRQDSGFKSLCPSVSSGKTLVRSSNPHPEAMKSPEQDYENAL